MLRQASWRLVLWPHYIFPSFISPGKVLSVRTVESRKTKGSSEISSRFINQESGWEHWAERTQAPCYWGKGFLILRVLCDRPCSLKKKRKGGLGNREGGFRSLSVNLTILLTLKFFSSLNYLGPGAFIPAGVCFSCLFGIWIQVESWWYGCATSSPGYSPSSL